MGQRVKNEGGLRGHTGDVVGFVEHAVEIDTSENASHDHTA